VTGAGGGIAQVSSNALTLSNTIVAGNRNDADPSTIADDVFAGPGAGSLNAASSLIGDAATAGGIANGSNGNKVGNAGSGTMDVNAVLDTLLANNGGTTWTHLLKVGSPALDAGDNALAKDQNNNALNTDQRGFARIVDTVDIGALEVQAPDHLAFTVQPSNSSVGATINPAVTVQILDAGNHPTTSTANVTISIGANPGGSTLGGTATVAAVNGTATFNDLSINNAAVGYTLVAGSTGLAGITSNLFDIQKANQSITVSMHAPANAAYNASFTVAATSSSGLGVAYSSSGVCTNVGPLFTMTGGSGTCTVKYDQAGDNNYTAATQVTESVAAQKANQSILVGTHAPANAAYNASFTVAATSDSGLAIAYSSSGVCTNVGPTFTMTSGAGTCTVKYDQAGDTNYNAATQVTESVTAEKAIQSINVSTHAPANATYNASFTVAATSNSALAVSYSSSGVCTNVGPTFTMTDGTGACTVKYDQAGDNNYTAATQVTESVTAQKVNQSINITTHAPATAAYNTSFIVAAASNSSLAVAYSSSGACTNVGPTFTMTSGAGTCTVKYAQSGDGNYNAATQVTEAVAAQKVNQFINIATHAPATAAYNISFTVAATSNSGLAIAYSSSGACTNLGPTFTMTSGAGTCTVKYDQSGDGNYNAATQVTESVTAQKATTNATVLASLNPSELGQSVTFTATVGATSATPTGTVQFKIDGANSGAPVTLNGSGVAQLTTSSLTVGTHTVTADYSGDGDFAISTGTLTGVSVTDSRTLVSLGNANFDVNESTGFVTITVNRTGNPAVPISVDYATDDPGSSNVCGATNGLASSRCDFDLALGTLQFAANETQKTFVIPITQDSFTEGPETFTVNLSNLIGAGAALAMPSSATVTISDGTNMLPPNAIDDTEVFVRQQYRDFLNRDADPAGLAFWKNNIDHCNMPGGADGFASVAQCIELMRINTSAAFFLSIEFQSTGNLVRSFYVAALNRPATNGTPAFAEFERDTQAMQRGVVVGQGNWQQTLNDNRDAFMKEFVMRPEFIGLYPTVDSPGIYLTNLYQHALGRTPTATELQAGVNEFPNGATQAVDPAARGRALLRVTQATDFQSRELNRSFVQMEYFGYLRRNPNDAPDGDFSGYDFWLNKLNAVGGNYLQAEMVKAFLRSSEYRGRFGP
jgi:Bacterial Ig-like domain (group 3)